MTLSHDEMIKNLRKRGYRITPQREKILHLFNELPEGTHLSADELLTRLHENNIKISLATLYRTLKLLSSIGLLRELDFAEDHKHYELFRGKSSYHHHLVCVHCNSTLEVHDKTLYELGEKLAHEYDMELIDVQFKLFGICKNCQDKVK